VKKDEAGNGARIADDLRESFPVFYDDSGAIGRRYRRQDEVVLPFASRSMVSAHEATVTCVIGYSQTGRVKPVSSRTTRSQSCDWRPRPSALRLKASVHETISRESYLAYRTQETASSSRSRKYSEYSREALDLSSMHSSTCGEYGDRNRPGVLEWEIETQPRSRSPRSMSENRVGEFSIIPRPMGA